jgi:DNA-binding transcriptional regulator YiaG
MNLNTVLVEAITKGAGRVTRKPIAALRRDVAELKRQVAELKRLLRDVRKVATAPRAAAESVAVDAGDTVPRIRPTSPMVRKLRAKLGLTQAEFAKLAGVSGLTVYKWEKSAGRINPRGRALAGLAKVMGMGKREAKKALANVET